LSYDLEYRIFVHISTAAHLFSSQRHAPAAPLRVLRQVAESAPRESVQAELEKAEAGSDHAAFLTQIALFQNERAKQKLAP